jgi:hypothetical protein
MVVPKLEDSFVDENDVVEEVEHGMKAGIQDAVDGVPTELKVDVQEISSAPEPVNAALPEEHAATEGLAEPIPAVSPVENTHPEEGLIPKLAENQVVVAKDATDATDATDAEVYFDNGEVDLLGSLEKSLGAGMADKGEDIKNGDGGNIEQGNGGEPELPTAAPGPAEDFNATADSTTPVIPSDAAVEEEAPKNWEGMTEEHLEKPSVEAPMATAPEA